MARIIDRDVNMDGNDGGNGIGIAIDRIRTRTVTARRSMIAGERAQSTRNEAQTGGRMIIKRIGIRTEIENIKRSAIVIGKRTVIGSGIVIERVIRIQLVIASGVVIVDGTEAIAIEAVTGATVTVTESDQLI